MEVQKNHFIKILFVPFLLLLLLGAAEVYFAEQLSPEIPVANNPKIATSWEHFTTYMADETVDEIRLEADITATSNIFETSFAVRKLTINGGIAQHKINMRHYRILFAAAPTTVLFSIVNVEIRGQTTASIFDTPSISLENSNNWLVHMKNSKVTTESGAGLINLPNGTIYFSGETTIYGTGRRSQVFTKKIFITNNFFFEADPSGLMSQPFTTLSTEGQADIRNSEFTANTSGTLFYSAVANTSITMNVENTRLTIYNANQFYLGSGKSNVNFLNTNISITQVAKNFISTNSLNAPLNIDFINSPINGNSVVGSLFSTTGENSSITANLIDSPIKMSWRLGGFLNIEGVSSNITSTVERSSIETSELRGSVIGGGKVNSRFIHSSIKMTTTFSDHLFQIGLENSSGSAIHFSDSDVNAQVTTTAPNYPFNINGQTTITADNSDFNVSVPTKFMEIATTAPGTKLIITGGSIWNIASNAGNAINAGSPTTGIAGTEIIVDGAKTTLNLSSNSSASGSSSGIIYLSGANAKLRATNGASLNVKGRSTSSAAAIHLNAPGGGVYVSDNSTLTAETMGSSDVDSATIRFGSSNMTFDASTRSVIDVKKQGGSTIGSQAIQFQGENQIIRVRGGSDFKVYNQGFGMDGNNIAVFYTSDSFTPRLANSIDIQDEGSNVSIHAEKGQALVSRNYVSGNYRTELTAGADTYFSARGATNLQNESIFSGLLLDINLATMKYYDFANTRPNGGRILMTTNTIPVSTFKSAKSNLNIWVRTPELNRQAVLNENGSVNLLGDPDQGFASVVYQLSGWQFANFDAGSSEVQTYYSSSGGMFNYTRMNGGNQRAKLTDLRTPTTADKYIWARASVPEGKNEANRDAYTDEVTLQVSVYNSDGSFAFTAEGKSIGNSNNNGGVSVYGEKLIAGMIKIAVPNDEFLKAGQKVVVDGLWRGEKTAANLSRPEEINIKERTTIDVTPPSRPVIEPAITNASKQLKGKGEVGADVFVKMNGTWLKDKAGNLITTTVKADGWTLNLSQYLTKGDIVEIYLKDRSGIITLPSYELPKTYTQEPNGQYGNLNVATDNHASFKGYHDATNAVKFASSTKIITTDVLPDNPTFVQSVLSSSGSTTVVGDTLTYSLKVGNGKAGSQPWEKVKISDVIPDEVTFDLADHRITIARIAANSDQFTYDESTRNLMIDVGNIAANEVIEVTFKVTVNEQTVGRSITNRASAKGNSPQENPFVPGSENPAALRHRIEIAANDVQIPGGVVSGYLSLLSAPSTLNFGSLTYDGKTQRIENPSLDKQLVVKDTRENTPGGWVLTASLSQPMKNQSEQELINALRYVYQGEETILDSHSQIIHVNNSGVAGEYDITDYWGTSNGSDGIKLQIGSEDIIYTGEYSGVITWRVMAGQP